MEKTKASGQQPTLRNNLHSTKAGVNFGLDGIQANLADTVSLNELLFKQHYVLRTLYSIKTLDSPPPPPFTFQPSLLSPLLSLSAL